MDTVWIIGALILGWAVLRVLGAERERRMREMPAKLALLKHREELLAAQEAAANQPPESAPPGLKLIARKK